MLPRITIALSLSLMAAGCANQSKTTTLAGSPQSPPSRAATASPHADNDIEFVREAAMSGRMEIQLGRMAAEQAASEDIRRFGERMVRDHTRANDRLVEIAESKEIELPRNFDREHQQPVDHLSSLRGAEFDRLYINHVIEDHEKDVAAFRRMAENTQDPEIRAFAVQTLPVLEEHLKMARNVRDRVAQSGENGATTQPSSNG